MIIGTMRFAKGERLTMSNYDPSQFDTEIEVVEDVEVDVEAYNSYTSYFVEGKTLTGEICRVNKCPYAYNIIKNERFKPNEKFFDAFPYLKEQ